MTELVKIFIERDTGFVVDINTPPALIPRVPLVGGKVFAANIGSTKQVVIGKVISSLLDGVLIQLTTHGEMRYGVLKTLGLENIPNAEMVALRHDQYIIL